ncbi:zinc finger protein [Fusarium albosuccineum]|uniref:Zinc finger protein n=1 Tax=Fusarium albosuccineum TaxID=1237068 RepID=A0A8H4LI57_9HYPO|nr:zinc finger protein [Fusarium albosuccineum]KAF5012531.1 hypothetical protein FDECE_1430 [Fusarium decemcellulare]
MVKHQRRSHQQGMNPNDILDDCSSDSDDDEPPSTPQHSAAMTWSPQDIVPLNHGIPHGSLHRASSYADFDQHVHAQHLPPQYGNRQAIPSNVPHEFQGQHMPDHHAGVQMVHRPTNMPRQAYYVTEQGNPGVATMTNAVQPHYQLSQQVERPPLEVSYPSSGIATSIQSSPSAFSATSVPSPMVPEGFYAHQPGNPPAYTAADSQQGMIQYHQPIQHPMSQSQQPVTTQAQQMHAPTADHYPPPPTQSQQEQWSHYDPPIEVTTIGQLPAYGTGVYDIYGPKIEFDDPSMQLPSSRLASL